MGPHVKAVHFCNITFQSEEICDNYEIRPLDTSLCFNSEMQFHMRLCCNKVIKDFSPWLTWDAAELFAPKLKDGFASAFTPKPLDLIIRSL